MFKEGSLWYQPSEEMNGLLVTSEPLVIATKNAQPVANGGIFNIDGKTFVNNFGYRRIPAEGQILDATNTTPYIYDSSYGYRRALDESPIIEDAFRLKQRSGGNIHIAPSKKGTFTAAATKHGMGVQEFAARVLRNKSNYSPSLVKKANFARNASKWNH